MYDAEMSELKKKVDKMLLPKSKEYQQGRADGIEKCIEEVIPILYEFDVEQEVIDYVQKWLENLKEQKK